MKIYISGPSWVDGVQNYDAFMRAEDALRQYHHDVCIVNPARFDWRNDVTKWMRLNTPRLLVCVSMAQLPGWENDRVAQFEHHVAETVGITVIDISKIMPEIDVIGSPIPCKFCGKPVTVNNTNEAVFWTHCLSCHMSGPSGKTHAEAVDCYLRA